AGEVSLTVVLLAAGAMVVRGGMRWHLLDRGMNTRNLLVTQVWLPQAKYPKPWQVSGFYEQALRRIGSLPRVHSSHAVNFLPLDIISDEVDFNVAGRTSRDEEMKAEYKIVDSLYFRTLGIPLVEGRYFADSDADERRGVVIVSRSLARSLGPSESPIGK